MFDHHADQFHSSVSFTECSRVDRIHLTCIDRVAIRRPNEKLNKHSIESFPSRFTEQIDAYDHPLMPIYGLIFISAQQAIPPWQVESKVGVRLVRVPGMMHPGHVGRHHDPPQSSVDGWGDAYIAMVEQ